MLGLPYLLHRWLGSYWCMCRKSYQVLVRSLSWWVDLGLWKCGAVIFWAYSLLLVSEYLSLTFWSSNGDNFFHSLSLLRDISLSWGAVCPLLDKMNTWIFHRIYFLVIISFYMLLMKKIYTALSRECRYTGGWDARRVDFLYYGRWSDGGNGIKIVRYVMTLILDVGRDMKCMMTLNLYLMTFHEILEIAIHMDLWNNKWRNRSCVGWKYCLFLRE